MHKVGIKSIYESIRHPQTNGVERYMKQIGVLFRLFSQNDHRGLVDELTNVAEALNLNFSMATGVTPVVLL